MAERAKGVEQGVALRARVNGWITVQVNFAPGTVAVRQSLSEALNTNDASEIPAWSIPLCLPSDPGANEHYTHRARRYEFKYRIAQAETSLQDLRNALIYEAHMRRSKEKYSSGTEQTTHSVQVLKDMSARVNLEVERYQHVRRRLVLLWEHIKDAEDVEEHGGWWDILQILEDNHITGPTWLDDERIGEGGKMLSWIWTVPGTGSNSKQVALAGMYYSIFPQHCPDITIPSSKSGVLSGTGASAPVARGVPAIGRRNAPDRETLPLRGLSLGRAGSGSSRHLDHHHRPIPSKQAEEGDLGAPDNYRRKGCLRMAPSSSAPFIASEGCGGARWVGKEASDCHPAR